MSTAVTTFVLSIAGALIVGLLGVLWWFIRDRMRARERKEDLLERRLAAGAQTMGEVRNSIIEMKDQQIQIAARFVPEPMFNEYKQAHREEHEKQDRRLDSMQKDLRQVREAQSVQAAEMKKGFGTMTDMLAKVVKIPTDPGDK